MNNVAIVLKAKGRSHLWERQQSRVSEFVGKSNKVKLQYMVRLLIKLYNYTYFNVISYLCTMLMSCVRQYSKDENET